MSRFEDIIHITDAIIEKYGTRNPLILAEEQGVIILYRNFDTQKGLYTVVNEKPFIIVNNNLEEEEQNIIITHELGHYILHSDELGSSAMLIEDNIFSKTTNRLEYEANLFTAEILLPDDEILEYVYNGNTQLEITLAMRSDVNLVAMKIDSLIKQGYDLNKLEFSRNFM